MSFAKGCQLSKSLGFDTSAQTVSRGRAPVKLRTHFAIASPRDPKDQEASEPPRLRGSRP